MPHLRANSQWQTHCFVCDSMVSSSAEASINRSRSIPLHLADRPQRHLSMEYWSHVVQHHPRWCGVVFQMAVRHASACQQQCCGVGRSMGTASHVMWRNQDQASTGRFVASGSAAAAPSLVPVLPRAAAARSLRMSSILWPPELAVASAAWPRSFLVEGAAAAPVHRNICMCYLSAARLCEEYQ